VEAPIPSYVSREELTRLAIKLREHLINYEHKFGSSREFAELMHSAGALIMAITEPEEFNLSASRTDKPSPKTSSPNRVS
jgi:hypothetical protein